MSEKDEEVKIPSKEELLGNEEGAEDQEDLGTGEPGDDPLASFEGEAREMAEAAMALGWNPDKDSVGDKWVSAEVFLGRQPFVDEVRKLKRALKNRDKEVDSIKQHLEMVRQNQVKETIKELKSRKRQAMEDGDYEAVDEIDELLDSAKEDAKPKVDTSSTEQQVNEVYQEWKKDNSWYGKGGNEDLTEFADGVARGLVDKYQDETGMINDLEGFYEEITKKVKKHYPEQFGGKKQSNASAVEPGKGTSGRKRGGAKRYSINDIPEEDRAIAQTMIRMIGEEQYYKDYFGEK